MPKKDSITCLRRRRSRGDDSRSSVVRLMGELVMSLERVCPWDDIHCIFSRMVDDKEFVARFLGDALMRFKREAWLDDLVEEEKGLYRNSSFFGEEAVKKMEECGVFHKFKKVLRKFGFFRLWQWEMLKLEPHVLPYTTTRWMFEERDFILNRSQGILGLADEGSILMPNDDFELKPIAAEDFLQLAMKDEKPAAVVLIDTREKSEFMHCADMLNDDEKYMGPILKEMREPEEKKNHIRTRESILMSRYGLSHEQWRNFVLPRMLALKIFEGVKKIRYERVVETALIQDVFNHMPRTNEVFREGAFWCEEVLHHEKTGTMMNFICGPLSDQARALHYFYDAHSDQDRFPDGTLNLNKNYISIRPIIVLA